MFEARLGPFAAAGPCVRLALWVIQHLQRHTTLPQRERPGIVGVPLERSVIEGPHILPAPSAAWPRAAVSVSRLPNQAVWCLADD